MVFRFLSWHILESLLCSSLHVFGVYSVWTALQLSRRTVVRNRVILHILLGRLPGILPGNLPRSLLCRLSRLLGPARFCFCFASLEIRDSAAISAFVDRLAIIESRVSATICSQF